MPAPLVVGKLALGLGLLFVRSRLPQPIDIDHADGGISVRHAERVAQPVDQPDQFTRPAQHVHDLARRVWFDRPFERKLTAAWRRDMLNAPLPGSQNFRAPA